MSGQDCWTAFKMNETEQLRQSILAQVAEYYQKVHQARPFNQGETTVHYAGRVFDERELQNMVSAVLDFWLTAGPETEKFEQAFGQFLGVREVIPVNSGSSANLVAMTTMTSNKLENPLRPGDEVIVPAASFPTTVNPILQNRLVPVFIDSCLGDFNLDITQLEDALSAKTRAITFAHTLGNPADMDAVMDFVKAHNLVLIEDTCDALGSKWDGKLVGTFGDMATVSFYPAHHITLGEGGAAFTNSPKLAKIARAVRDWGRDCWCGYDNPVNGKCGIRFDRQIPGIQGFYDHRYYYSEIGYNLKLTDPQAAMGLAQLKKLPQFIARRKENFAYLYKHLNQFSEHLMMPTWHKKADPSWFAFPLLVRRDAPFLRHELTRFLEQNKVQTRLIFAGNILRQPAYQGIPHRVAGDLPISDQIMEGGFFVGVYPGLDRTRLDYMIDQFDKFFKAL
jgi:CDP-6-deoxy-D-xylo-4-hexulose-3-dehydrase